MNLEIEVNTEVEVIEVLKITVSDKKNSKSMYLELNNDQLIRLVEQESIDVKGVETVVIKESISKSVGINNVKKLTIPVKVNMNKEKIEEEFTKFVDKYHKKENTTTDGSDELRICSECGVKAERKDAKFCFHCGTKFE